jgi:ABC-2 type transport system ATP-binding protein
MSIEAKNLTKIYGTQKAIDHISFRVDKGEIVGFLGPNGAGKSTTMKILTSYLQPDEGEAIVNDLNVKSHSLESKKKIGYLPEGNPLYYDQYVREYLDFIADVHGVKNKKQKIEETIHMVGLTSESRKIIGQLSKGFKQRVGLAAALIHDPEVLILDEPTTGLDPNQIIEIRELIRTLGKNKTVLFSSHILQEVEAICDRVIIINKLVNLQQANRRGHFVLVQFEHPVDINLLQQINEIEKMEILQGATYKLETSNPESVRKQLLQLSLQHNLNIVSLQTREQSLEEIFRELTGTDQEDKIKS